MSTNIRFLLDFILAKQHPEPIRASLTRFNTLSHLRMGIVEAVFPIRKPALGIPHQGLALVAPFALC
jgi:hypothetical protein